MWSISQKLGIRVKDLYYKNLMQPNDQPLAGEELFLQEKRNSPPKTITYAEYLKSLNINQQPTANSSQFSNSNVYQVQQKDTLYSIAKKFNTTVEKIKELNSIQESSIKTGQTLVITE
jgi:LysM repeat protein